MRSVKKAIKGKTTKKNCDIIQNVKNEYGKDIQKCETFIKMHKM